MLKAIIFDMDGVIVDTEYTEFMLQKGFIEKLKQHNRPITLEQQSETVGKSLNDIPEIIKKLSGTSLSLQQVRQQYRDFFHQIFSQVDFVSIFRQEIKNIIYFAKQNNIKLAVASSSPLTHIENILSTCGIKQDFDLIVSGEMFSASKPNPEIYQYTLNTLQVSAQNAIAIEDSYYGILAAKKAGLTVIAYEEKRMIVDQSQADYIAPDMNAILQLITQQNLLT